MATAGSRWGVVMSRNSGYSEQVRWDDFLLFLHFLIFRFDFWFIKSPIYLCLQVVELDFLYPSEGVHRRWDGGYRITSTAATTDQAALILSIPRRRLADETQETLRTSQFPSTHVKVSRDYSNLSRLFWFCSWFSFPLNNTWDVMSYVFLSYAGKMGKESLPGIFKLWPNCVLKFTEKCIWNWTTLYCVSVQLNCESKDLVLYCIYILATQFLLCFYLIFYIKKNILLYIL